MTAANQYEKHAVFRIPTPAEAKARGAEWWMEAMGRRARAIANERADPLNHGWEPPSWRAADGLLGLNWQTPDTREWEARERENERIQQRMGLRERVRVLLIEGGNRGSKSQYAARTMMRMMLRGPHRGNQNRPVRTWCFHQSLDMSREYQQPLLWHYMPPHLRERPIRTDGAYIAYKAKTGFSEDSFILPNMSSCSLRYYEQDIKNIEGGEIDAYWADELIPAEWVTTLDFRLATRNGVGIITFTPVNGYTATVQMFHAAATVKRTSPAYLLPKDGGKPDVARALGFPSDAHLKVAQEYGPNSIPEPLDDLLTDAPPPPAPPPDGRTFDTVPRVMVCPKMSEHELQRSVLFFHSSDNPFGNPLGVAGMVLGKPAAFIKERYYGYTERSMGNRFPSFNEDVHVIDDEHVPLEGINIHTLDPAGARNFFMNWIRITPDNCWYIYKEWPGNYEITGVGHIGPWAMVDGKKLDGRPGPAQSSFGWGLIDYKNEIARIEGWKDYRAREEMDDNPDERKSWEDQVKAWSPMRGAQVPVSTRLMDPRAGATEYQANGKPATLRSDFAKIGLVYRMASGSQGERGNSEATWVSKINDMLRYDPKKPIDYFNRPKLYIAKSCINTIFAFKLWTGTDGLKGAVMDPIVCVKYPIMSRMRYMTAENFETEETGSW